MTARVPLEEVIAAYNETRSIWRAGKRLGLAGQSVHERLRAAGIPTPGPSRRWTDDEVEELRLLAATCTLGEIAHRLGRSYPAIACKINEIGAGSRFGNRQARKPPRGAGYDKVSTLRHIKTIDKTGTPITKYARANGLNTESFIRAVEVHNPEWWMRYRQAHSDLPVTDCPACGGDFIPSNKRQRFCTRRCADHHRQDQAYFGGQRHTTIGLAENRCQICGKTPKNRLSSHHMYGKENDPDNTMLIALCSGCHQLVTMMGGREWSEQQWESLISLAWIRKHGPELAAGREVELSVMVDIDADEPDGSEDDEPDAEPGQPTGATITVTAL